MEVIVRGKRVEVEKECCFENVNEWIAETLGSGTLDIRRVIKSLDKLGKYMLEEEQFLVPELTELGFSKEEAIQIKKEALPVIT